MASKGRFRILAVDPHSSRMRQLFLDQLPSPDFVFECPAREQPGELRKMLVGANALVTRHRFIDEELIRRAGPDLKVIQIQGRLSDRADVDAAARAGVPVAVMPSRGATAVAEHTLALMLALARRIVPGHLGTRGGGYRELGLVPNRTSETVIAFNWLGLPDVQELSGKTLGLVGLGEVAQEVARRARAFDMSVLYHRRRRLPEPYERLLEVQYASLRELLARSDWVSLHVPHTPETECLLDAKTLALMKPTAFLVNTARGGVVDQTALVDSLRGQRIAGAGLDVFVEEPLPADHPLGRLDNVVLTPHLGGGSGGGHRRHVSDILDNIARVARGDPPRHRVPSEAGPRS